MIKKPSYSTTKLALWLSSAAAWSVIFLLLIAATAFRSQEAVALVPSVMPFMVGMIVAILGIHRGFGSLDMYSITKQAPPEVQP